MQKAIVGLWMVTAAVLGCGSESGGEEDTQAVPSDQEGTAEQDPASGAQESSTATPGAAGTAAGADGPNAGDTGELAPATGGPISEECRGFSFEDLVHSPGSDVLPNICEAFHPTLNNPYAVRCVDVWPWFQTDYPGDEFCILPPPPHKGI